MRRKVRAIALVLSLLILMSALAACSDKEKKDDTDISGMEWADDLPELDYHGSTVSILHREGDWIKLYECDGEAGTDIVHKAVYERNLVVEQRLGVKLEWIPTASGGLEDTKTEIVNLLSAWVDDYDLILTTGNTIISTGMNAYLYDFSGAPYIDLDKEYWWTDCMEEVSFDGTRYNFLIGEMLLNNFMKMSAFYFNTALIQKYLGMTPKDMYGLVDSGQWTIEKLTQFCSRCYHDLNGNNIQDDADMYGLAFSGSSETLDQFLLSTDVELYRREKSGFITIDMDTNDVYELCEKMKALMHNGEGVRRRSAINGSSGFDSFLIEDFAEEKYVFLAQRFTAAFSDAMREMETDYGIIPYPTLREGDKYVSYIQTSSTCVACPYSVDEERFARGCAVLEALASQSYSTVTLKFYEYALKSKNVRDDYDSPRMIDIIYNSATKCFLAEYSSAAGGILSTMNSAVVNKSSISTQLASKQSAAQTTLNKFIADCIASYSGG